MKTRAWAFSSAVGLPGAWVLLPLAAYGPLRRERMASPFPGTNSVRGWPLDSRSHKNHPALSLGFHVGAGERAISQNRRIR